MKGKNERKKMKGNYLVITIYVYNNINILVIYVYNNINIIYKNILIF